MAYRLIAGADIVRDGASLLDCAPLNCFDTVGNDGFIEDRAGMLAQRSAFELVRDQLDEAQLAELDRIDAFWRENAEAFNKDFALDMSFLDKKTVLSGLVEDEKGRVPEVQASDWWWRAIEEGGE